MKKRDYKLFIKDIVDAMEHIEKFVGNMALDELEADEKTSSAVIRKFEVIGEAVKHIPNKVKEKHKDIQWKSMAGMRDRLIHAYFSGARQVVGHVSAKDDTLKLETMTKSGLKEARSLIESVLEGAIIFEKEEFEDPVEKFRR